MEISSSRPRRPWLACLLSLFGGGPLGQVYVGQMRRSLCLWLVGSILFLLLAFATVGFPIGPFGFLLLSPCVVAFPVYLAADAFLLAKRNRHASPKRYQRWWVYVFFCVLFSSANSAVAHLVRSFVTESFVVPTRSMSPTIQPGDRIVVDKLWYHRSRVHRNDVVLFHSEGADSALYFQRVVGLPGDEVEIRNDRVFVNGAKWSDLHGIFVGLQPPLGAPVDYGPAKVPPDSCFLLGDNRRMSKDSRVTGPISMSALHGVARWIFWSRERTFPNPNDTRHYVSGPIRWERIGLRLD